MDVFICEDDPIQRTCYETIIRNHIMIESLEMRIALVKGNPLEVLTYLEKNEGTIGVYFLDIDLGNQLTGLDLAKEIRKRDALGKIIFITTHDELAPLTYSYKVEALEFIVKSSHTEKMAVSIKECLDFVSQGRSTNGRQKRQVAIKQGMREHILDMDDILFFETTGKAHRLYVHTKTGKIEFYGKIKEMEQHGENFIRVHKSYVVNRENIKMIDRATFELEMCNGQRCAVGRKKLKLLKVDLE